MSNTKNSIENHLPSYNLYLLILHYMIKNAINFINRESL